MRRNGPVQPKSSGLKSVLAHCISLLPCHHSLAYYQGLQSNHIRTMSESGQSTEPLDSKPGVRHVETTHNFKVSLLTKLKCL